MVWRGALERCETGANPLETRGKRKPVTPENDPRETGLSFLNGGGGGNRTPVRNSLASASTGISHLLSLAVSCSNGHDLKTASLINFAGIYQTSFRLSH